jgi:hypothetical protein
MTSGGPHQEPTEPAARQPAVPAPGGLPPRRGGVDLRRLTLADSAVAAGAVLYLVLALIPWFSIAGIDFGGGFRSPGFSINGFDSGLVTLAFVLLLAAAVWAVLPALTDVPVPFPRSAPSVGLAAPAFLLTAIEWLRTFDLGFSLVALLTVLVVTATLGFALVGLLPELRDQLPRSGGRPHTAQRADQYRPQSGPGSVHPGHGTPPGYSGPPGYTGPPSDRGFAPPPQYGPSPAPGSEDQA